LVKDIINGVLPDSCRSLLLACVLVGAKKPKGGTRPIAMGETFYKLAGLYSLSLVRSDIPAIMEPIQFALSSGGSESALHILQAAIDAHPDWVVISADLSNAFNSRKRSQILASLFNEPTLSPLYRLAYWSYSKHSQLLTMQNGKVVFTMDSQEGVKQGDILASLLFALSMRTIYSDSIKDLDTHAVAVMDDIYFFGRATPTFTAFDRFSSTLISDAGLQLCLPKTIALLPSDTPSYTSLCSSRSMSYSISFINALGSILSRNHRTISDWLLTQLSQHKQLFDLLKHPLLPTQHSYNILRCCMVPRMNYWSRVISPTSFHSTALAFDKLLLDTATSILGLPALSTVAQLQLSLPIRHGGFGLRSMMLVSPAAWWSSLAQAYRFISPLLPSPSSPSMNFSFVISQSQCHSFFEKFHVPFDNKPVPPLPTDFWTSFASECALPGTQRLIMKSIYNTQYTALLSDSKSPSPDYARIVSVSQPSSGLWLTSLPFHPSLSISNGHFSIASRIRLGLTPVDNLATCSCSASLKTNPLHFLDCRLLRSHINARHHRITHTFARISRLVGIAVVLEPRIGMDDMSRTDGNFFLTSLSAQTDVCVVHPSSSSYLKLATKPLGTCIDREKKKDHLYLRKVQASGSLFFPLVMESYGAVGQRARDFIRLLDDEASKNSISSLYGQSITNFLLRSISIVLQSSNAAICSSGAIISRSRSGRSAN
jgi:hypothetical protein